jgi:hypothetical protein
MATVITTIDERELDYRIDQAAFALFEGKRVRLQAGLFRASGLTPKQLMHQLLNGLRCQELEWLQSEYGVTCGWIKPREWRVMITRKPEDLSFVVQATCVD